MNLSSSLRRVSRNLRALFVLAFFVTLPWVVVGAGLLIACYRRPDMTKPLWEFGQMMLIFASCNFAIYVGLFTQARRLLNLLKAYNRASQGASPIIRSGQSETDPAARSA